MKCQKCGSNMIKATYSNNIKAFLCPKCTEHLKCHMCGRYAAKHINYTFINVAHNIELHFCGKDCKRDYTETIRF